MAIVTLLGFILNYTPFGIHLEVMAIILFVFIVVFAILTIVRRRKLNIERLRLKHWTGVFNSAHKEDYGRVFETADFNPEFKPTIKRIMGKISREEQDG